MKELIDGTKVVARMYYYLLDYNDLTGWEYIRKKFKKNSLSELHKNEFMQLFEHATKDDLNKIK